MAMCGDGGILLLGSSVYRKKGYMYRKYKQLHGNNDGEDICWFAPSATMNPILPMQFVEKALAEELAKAGAEFLNRWREDLVDFIPVDVVEGCTDFNVHERSPRRDVNYCAYCDPAGGTGPTRSRLPSPIASTMKPPPFASILYVSASPASPPQQ